MNRPTPPQSVRLERFNALEVRGLYLLQQQILDLSSRIEPMRVELAAREQEAAQLLAGRVPDGTTIRTLRIDVAGSGVFALAAT